MTNLIVNEMTFDKVYNNDFKVDVRIREQIKELKQRQRERKQLIYKIKGPQKEESRFSLRKKFK
eukprot:CAMPEP_0170563486 /NCGR_PEP_ID=MMETSP0211-20121228/66913_1 /TAXON_ID=311385 /ORGANISM="Pseudokeronopsis sp., Strain OXSARD2" /LENGTH=63 /DNA_ID=CAMNT_0010881787 /DNA_START=314 /DNA_END=502 /DNA_ORIENTATION=-